MSRDESKVRRYSDQEFALILRKAAELQEAPGDRGGRVAPGGFTLEEIRSIAAEAGIAPQAVTRAAAVLGVLEGEGRTGLAQAMLAAPAKYYLTLEVPGALQPREIGRILEELRRAAEHQGEANEVLGGVEWKSVGQTSAISVNISPRPEGTSIQIVGDRSGAGLLTALFSTFGSLYLVGVVGSILEPSGVAQITALVAPLLGGGLLIGRTLWARGSRRFQARLARLMETLSRSVERSSLPPAPED
jgi:hypothetical protein